MAIFDQRKPCGHSWELICGCNPPGFTWTSAELIFNGLCECRGPMARHPFHTEPLPPEYVGRHRKPEE